MMANNRMYLCHKTSGLAVYLGKRMADGYYSVPENLSKIVQDLFDRAEDFSIGPNDIDAYAIVMESCEKPNSHVITDFHFKQPHNNNDVIEMILPGISQ